jgi:nucleotide-binding universal stress UspA family protein
VKKILVPTDFSAEAENATEVARILAKKFNAEVMFLHTIELSSAEAINASGAPSNFDSVADAMFIHESIKGAREQMDRLYDVTKFQGLAVSQEIKLGGPFQHIYDAIENDGVDFIVMGTKGATGLSEVLIGSNTEKVVRRAKCPVLSVKSEVKEEAFKDIVYATEMGDNEGPVVDCLQDFQRAFNSKVHVVWVNTPNNFKADRVTMALLRDFVTKYSMVDYTINVFNDVVEEDGIIHFADEIGAGMIAMGTSSHTGLSRIIRGSIAEDIVNHAKRPVLTMSMKE